MIQQHQPPFDKILQSPHPLILDRVARLSHGASQAKTSAGSTVSDLSEAYIRNTVAQIPLGRASSRADVGNALLYLASDASSYVTGATLTVDGGNSAGTLAVHQDKKSAL